MFEHENQTNDNKAEFDLNLKVSDVNFSCKIKAVINTTLGKGPKEETNVVILNIHEYMNYYTTSIDKA